jgi:hypothetical protein
MSGGVDVNLRTSRFCVIRTMPVSVCRIGGYTLGVRGRVPIL